MSGVILYSANPRSLGTLPDWTAAVMEAERLGCNAIHLNPFHPVTALGKNYFGQPVSGSLYAMRDHFTINPEFLGEVDQAAGRAQLKDFIKLARSKNIRVFADLVFNHVAKDHPLVDQHLEYFVLNADGTLQAPGPIEDPWTDIAKINYEHPGAWEYFLGEGGYWLRLLDDYLNLGFNGLRCDAVQWLPQLVWEHALNHALNRAPDTIILAETLDLSKASAELMQQTLRESDARIIYDICYDDTARSWNGKDSLALNQMRADIQKTAAYYGAMGFIDSHDFRPRAAILREKYGAGEDADKKIAATCLRDYALACFTNNSVMLNRGYQWCIENNVGPFKEHVSAEFFKAIKKERKQQPSALTIGAGIAEMHKLRAQFPAHVTVRVGNGPETGYHHLSAIQCDFMTHGDERLIGTLMLFVNTAPEFGPQPFPHDYWQQLKEKQTNAIRMQFGPDKNHMADISGVAIIIVPGGLDTSMEFNQGQKLAANAPEPSLVA